MCGVRVGKNPINLPLIVWLPFVYIGATVDGDFIKVALCNQIRKASVIFARLDHYNLKPN